MKGYEFTVVEFANFISDNERMERQSVIILKSQYLLSIIGAYEGGDWEDVPPGWKSVGMSPH